MPSIWSSIGKEKNRKVLSWLGGGVVVAAGGAWALFTYVWPPHAGGGEVARAVCAQQGIAVGGSVSGSTVSNAGSGSLGAASCRQGDGGR